MSTPDRPGFDPDLRAWLASLPLVADATTPAAMRDLSRSNHLAARARMSPSQFAPSVHDQTVDGPAGPIPVRVLSSAPTAGPRPLIVHFHGGGWVVGDLETHLGHSNRLAVQAGAVVVSVDYRLAPEHVFPAAFDDCVAATEWAAANATALGADPDLLVVAGDSAGGQLAASVATSRRDAGEPLAAQLLLYPVIDVAGRYADPALDAAYPSRAAQQFGPGLSLAGMAGYAAHYVTEADARDWRVNPLSADLHGVAPAVVHTAGFDLLRDEGNRFAEQLRAADVRVIAREFASLNHSYFGMGGVSAAADQAAAQSATDLREILGLPPLTVD